MKKSKVNARRESPPVAKTGTAASTATSPSKPQTKPRRNAWALIALIAALLLLAYTRRDSLRERWLETQSIETLQQLAVKSDGDTLVYYHYTRRLVDAGSLTDAVSPSTRAVSSLSPATPRDLSGRVFALAGYVAARMGNEHDSEDWLQRAATSRPDDVFLLLGRGSLALYHRRIAEAATALTEATHRDPSRADAWNALGNALRIGTEPERAVEAHRHAVALAPRDPQYHADLVQALWAAKRFSEADAEARVTAELAPQNPKYSALPAIQHAYAARTDTEYQEAVSLLRTALSSHSEDGRLRAILAGLHMRFGQHAAARQELETFLAQFPTSPASWHMLALSCERLGDRRGAEAAYTRFHQLIDRNIALTELKKEALLHRDDPAIFLRLTQAFRQAGRDREARVALEQAAKLRPDDPEIARSLQSLQAAAPQQEASPTIPLSGDEQP